MGKKLLALTRLRPQISDPTCLHQISIVLIVVFHISSQKGLAVKHHQFHNMFSHTLFRVHTYIYFCTSISFSFSFPILWFVNFVDFSHFLIIFYHHEFTVFKKKSQFLQKNFVATVRKFTKKNHFFHSGFICYDRPRNFSFSPQAAAIIATGQGEPAPTLVHSTS